MCSSAHPMTELTLIRHGQTHANVAGRWQGWSDGALTSLGRKQAEAVARRLAAERVQVAALYTSPLRRALQTARIIGKALGLRPVCLDDLREVNFGELDGISMEEMAARDPTLFARWNNKADQEFTWPGGEQRADFFHRVALTCDHIVTLHPNDSVVIVTHGGTLRACLAHLLPGQMAQWWTYPLDNCALTRVSREKAEFRLSVLNDGAHLPAQ